MASTISGDNGLVAPVGAVYNGIQSKTAVASTSGTSIDFTGIPSWVKRITVMFNGVSTNGTARVLIRVGSGSVATTGYSSIAGSVGLGAGATGNSGVITNGFVLDGYTPTVACTRSGSYTITNISGNTWAFSGNYGDTGAFIAGSFSGGTASLSGVLDRVSITTSGTDTFDAGSINILYE